MKVIYFDIENTPKLGYTWQMWNTNILDLDKDTTLLSFSWKVDGGPTKVESLRNNTERQLVKKLWKIFDEADILVAHNGDNFDIKMSNAYFVKYGLNPPSPYKSVDTLKIARRYFKFTRNSLDFLSEMLLGERKLHVSFDLWKSCMRKDEAALREMEIYNVRDVDLLYRLYQKLRGWHAGHPNRNVYNDSTHKCPICGGNTQKRGTAYTRTQKYQRYQCVGECKGWSTGERIPIDKVIK